MDAVVHLLASAKDGDEAAFEALASLLRQKLSRTDARATEVDTAEIVRGCLLRVGRCGAARSMRALLVERARRRQRGGERLDDKDAEILRVDHAIEALEPELRQIVELRYFGGLDEAAIASALALDERTVRRAWTRARLLLHELLR